MNRKPLLESKITIPEVPDLALWRARLSLPASQERIIQLIAPAGFGKTLLVSQWAERRKTELPVIWLSLDEEDVDAEQLLSYLAAACEKAGLPKARGQALNYLIDLLAKQPSDLLFVLDNCEAIADGSSAHKMLSQLLKHGPLHTRFVLLSRRELSWGLTRWQLVDKLYTITSADLAFTPEEVIGLLALQHKALPLMRAQAVCEETGGWPAALKILLSTRNLDEVLGEEAVTSQAFASALLFYLHDEVLSHLSSDQLTFIHATALVDLFTLRFAEHITSLDRQTCRTTLEWLLAIQLVEVVKQDKQEAWYQYRSLIAHALHSEALSALSVDTPEVLQKASRWLDEQGYTNQSVSYAERIGDYDHIVAIIERDWRDVFMDDNVFQAYRWARLLPRNLLLEHPWICCITMLAAFVCDDAELSSLCEEASTKYYLTENNQQDPHYAEALALIANMLSLRTHYDESRELANRALELLPHSDFFLRQTASQAREYAHPTIDYLHYRDMLLEYLPQIVAHGHTLYTANMYAFLADSEANLGNITAGLDYVRLSLETTAKFLHPERPTFMAIHRARMNAAFHRSSLGEAELHRSQYEKVTKASYSFPSLAIALAYGALFSYLRGDEQAIEPYLRESLRLSPSGLLAVVPSLSFFSFLESSGLLSLEHYLEQLPASHQEVKEFKRLSFYAPLLKGSALPYKKLKEGVAAIDEARRLDKVQGHIILALYEEHLEHWAKAEQALEQALAWAEPEQMSQLFYNDYAFVLPIITRLKDRIEPGSFAHTLSVHLSQLATGEVGHFKSSEQHMLTPRESEVVYLLVGGYKPQEIAGQLHISLETVRKHIVNSYRKLGVNSRTQLLLKMQ